MVYDNIREAKFVKRLNRFIAYIEIDGKIEICHVKILTPQGAFVRRS